MLKSDQERCEAQLAHIAELEAGYMHQHDEAEARVRQLDEVAAEAIRMHDEADTRALEAEALRTELTRVEAGINVRVVVCSPMVGLMAACMVHRTARQS